MTEIANEQIKERLGNVDQIRNLLFGNKIREYEEQFENSDRRLDKLESELTSFQSEMRDRLTQLQDSLSSEIRSGLNSQEKKLKYLSLTTHEETSKLQQAIDENNNKFTHELESLTQRTNSQARVLKNEIIQLKEGLEEEFRSLKEQIFTEVSKVNLELKEGKVSREDLAEVLFELCLKIKGTDFVPSLKEAADNHTKTDFILPERSGEQQ